MVEGLPGLYQVMAQHDGAHSGWDLTRDLRSRAPAAGTISVIAWTCCG